MKNLLFIIVFAIINSTLVAQTSASFLSEERQKEILSIIENIKDKRYIPPINPKTKVYKVLDGGIHCFNKHTAPFDIDYIDSLTVSDSSYFVYNFSDSSGYKVIALLYYLDDQPIFSGLSGNESKFLNDIGQLYDLNEVTALNLVGGVGYCIIHKNEVWIVDGKIQTDLNTFLKAKYTLDEYRDLFLQSTY